MIADVETDKANHGTRKLRKKGYYFYIAANEGDAVPVNGISSNCR